MKRTKEKNYPETPKISDLIIPFLRLALVFRTRTLANLNLQPTLVGQMKQTDETEARADILHLVPRIRLSQVRHDRVEHSRLSWIGRASVLVSIVYVLTRGKEGAISHVTHGGTEKRDQKVQKYAPWIRPGSFDVGTLMSRFFQIFSFNFRTSTRFASFV